MSAASVTSITLRKTSTGPEPSEYHRISDQELLDCVSGGSCSGGSLTNALNYIEESDHVKLASEYSYKAKKNSNCNAYGWSLFARPAWTISYDSYDS